jgi:hypothetical protein
VSTRLKLSLLTLLSGVSLAGIWAGLITIVLVLVRPSLPGELIGVSGAVIVFLSLALWLADELSSQVRNITPARNAARKRLPR